MEGGAIAESQISASSIHYGILGLQRWGPDLARLNNQGMVNAWTSASHDKNPWIEVRTSGRHRVVGLIGIGRKNDANPAVILGNNRLTCRRRCA